MRRKFIAFFFLLIICAFISSCSSEEKKFTMELNTSNYYDISKAETILNGYKSERKNETPVIIIPGIIGTELYSYEENSDDILCWPPFDNFSEISYDDNMELLTKLDNITLNDDLSANCSIIPSAIMPVKDTNYNIGTFNLYEKLCVYFSNIIGEENVFFFGYDFRYDSTVFAKTLNYYIKAIKKVYEVDSINIIAHSYGCLVSLSYIDQYGYDDINNLVTLGGPFLGSARANIILNDTESFMNDFVDVASLKESIGLLKFSFLKEFLYDTISSFPAIYNLLPYEILKENLYEGLAYEYGAFALNRCYSTLNKIKDSNILINIVGSEIETKAYAGLKDNKAIYIDSSGDGTVDLNSATANGLIDSKTKIMKNVGHGDLIKNIECLSYIKNKLYYS